MTREEILAMTPGQINRFVATEIMGWREVNDLAQRARRGYLYLPKEHVRYRVQDEQLYDDEPRFVDGMSEAWCVFCKVMSGCFSRRSRFYDELQQLTQAHTKEAWKIAWPDVLTVLRHEMSFSICRAAAIALCVTPPTPSAAAAAPHSPTASSPSSGEAEPGRSPPTTGLP